VQDDVPSWIASCSNSASRKSAAQHRRRARKSRSNSAEILGTARIPRQIRRPTSAHGGDFAEYLEKRDASTGELPHDTWSSHRDGNEETVHYFVTDENSANSPAKTRSASLRRERSRRSIRQRHRRAEGPLAALRLESTRPRMKNCFGKLDEEGPGVDHYSSQDKPLFELIEGEGDNAKVHPSSRSRNPRRREGVGKRGIEIKRFKGLGEMNAKELFETTMNPPKRKLLRIELTDAVEAEEMFTT
jgi:DNA gyrase subunit B